MNNQQLDKVSFKRFMLFTYVEYYPSGGLEDCNDSFDTLKEAYTAFNKESTMQYRYIYDRIDNIVYF